MSLDLPRFDLSSKDLYRDGVKEVKNAYKRLNEALETGVEPSTLLGLLNELDTTQNKYVTILSFKEELDFREDNIHYSSLYNSFLCELEEDRMRNKKLFKALQSINSKQLSSEEKILLDQEIESIETKTHELSESKEKEYFRVCKEIEKKTETFYTNYSKCLMEWSLHVTSSEILDGIPSYLIKRFRKNAKDAGQDGWLIKLNESIVSDILNNATNSSLRKKIYFASNTIASDYDSVEEDNFTLIKEILLLRDKKAKLLGYKSFADYRLSPLAVRSPTRITSLLRKLDRKVEAAYAKEIEEISRFAKKEVDGLRPWDTLYYAASLKEKKYKKIDMSEYLETVPTFKRFLRYMEGILNVSFVQKRPPSKIHKDMLYYEVFKDNRLFGAFYADLLSRNNKVDGCWVHTYTPNTIESHPVLFYCLNCSETMAYNDLIAMCHEFGHLVHALFNRIPYYQLSGLSSLNEDAIEFPSQYFENFAKIPSFLKAVSLHRKTGKKLTKKMIDNYMSSLNVDSGCSLYRYIKKSLADVILHHKFDAADSFVDKTTAKIFSNKRLGHEEWFNRTICQFHHSFGSDGGYDCLYYTYIWSELAAKDAFKELQQCRTKKEIRKELERFIAHFIEPTNQPLTKLFKEYAGRDFSADAWVEHYMLDK